MMSGEEGVAKGIAALKEVAMFEKPGEMWWD
jgi:hypothetical protein